MTRHRFLALALLIGLAPLDREVGAQTSLGTDTIRISGSTTVFTTVFDKGRDGIARDAGVTLEVIANGSRQGLADLLSNRSEIAMISAPLDEVVAQMPPAERARFDPSALVVSHLTDTQLVFVVNESNPTRALTIKQLSDLFTGASTNWNQVGGPNLKVEIVSNQFSSGQRAVLEEKVTSGKPVTATAKWVLNDPLIAGIVRQLKGGLGHSNARSDLRGVHVLKTDRPIVQPLFLITRGKPSGRIARVIAASQKAAGAR